ncbi:MAG: DUF3750 domain-containing protein [Methyloligellaceae bacterium]
MKILWTLSLCLVIFPVLVGGFWSYAQGWPASWHSADWSASGIALRPAETPEAVVQVYAARAGRWKGIFAVHTWIAVKRANAPRFDRYDVVGWGRPVRRNAYPIDGYWYGNKPAVILEVRGARAAKLIPKIEAAILSYPNRDYGTYHVWPGPNSNTFLAWIGRRVPELGLELPPTAVGKDYLGEGWKVGPTPSGSGRQVSWSGMIGAALGTREGFELHVLGATIGLDPQDLAIKLPAIGSFGLRQLRDSLQTAAEGR